MRYETATTFQHQSEQKPFRAFVLDEIVLWEFSTKPEEGKNWEGTKTVFDDESEAHNAYLAKRLDLEMDGYDMSHLDVDLDTIVEAKQPKEILCHWRSTGLVPVGSVDKLRDLFQLASDKLCLKLTGDVLQMPRGRTFSFGDGLDENQFNDMLHAAGSVHLGDWKEFSFILAFSKLLNVEFADDSGKELKLDYFRDVVELIENNSSKQEIEELSNDCVTLGFIPKPIEIVSPEQSLYF